MSDILKLQEGEPEETPGTEKASNISLYRICRNSYLSAAFCFAK